MGIRVDREFPFAKPDGVFRIVGLGDSFTFGYGVDVEETYLARLESLLRRQGVNAEVINLGVAGHGTAEELIMLRERGLKYEPDLVIVGYYTNDIADNSRSMLYSLNEREELVRNKREYLPAVEIRDFLYSFAVYRYLAEHSHLLYYVRRSLSEMLQKDLRKKQVASEGGNGDEESRRTAALLDEIKRVCLERNIAFRLLDIPRKTNESNLPRAFLNEIVEEDIVDLRPMVRERMASERIYWTRSDGHWTPAGHDIAAAALRDRIQASLTRPRATP